jgi:hypothetical protein
VAKETERSKAAEYKLPERSDYPTFPAVPWPAFGPRLEELLQATIVRMEREWPVQLRILGSANALFEILARSTVNTFHTIKILSLENASWPLWPEDVLSVPPLTRTLLDTLFSTVYLLDDLPAHTAQYYQGGWREAWEEHDRYAHKYAAAPGWSEWINEHQMLLDRSADHFGITAAQRANPKTLPRWPLPSKMARRCASTERRDLLNYLYDWYYHYLSAQSHLSYTGLAMRAAALIPGQEPGDRAWKLDKMRSDQFFAATLMVLAFASEIELEFHYGDTQRLVYVWTFLAEHLGMAKDLYEPWYRTRLAPSA